MKLQKEAGGKLTLHRSLKEATTTRIIPYHLSMLQKGRKLHPSARAKSVGHARRESLKYMRPPAPSSAYPQQELIDTGFLESSDDNKSDSLGNVTSQTNDSVSVHSVNAHINSPSVEKELTDEEILQEASRAPDWLMPSIDFPRSLFLKGFLFCSDNFIEAFANC